MGSVGGEIMKHHSSHSPMLEIVKSVGEAKVIKANRIVEVGAVLYYRCLGREDRGKARRVLY